MPNLQYPPLLAPLSKVYSHNSTTGLPSLPVEILKEILSYVASFPDLEPVVIRRPWDRDNRFERQYFLKFLLKTCRYLRAFALSLFWERIEVCYSNVSDRDSRDIPRRNTELLRELSRHLEVVTVMNPDLAKHVKVVRVAIPVMESQLAEKFARSLALLPNLTTINIELYGLHSVRLWAAAFRDISLPSVRTVRAPISIMPIFKACTNAKVAKISNYFRHISHRTRNPYTNVFKSCPGSIEEFDSFTEWFDRDVKQYVKLWPNTKVINFHNAYLLEVPKSMSEDRAISEFKKLSNLTCVRVWSYDSDFDVIHTRDQRFIDFAKKIVALNPPPPGEHKCVILQSYQADKKKNHIIVSGDASEDTPCRYFREERVEPPFGMRYFSEKSSIPNME